MLPLPAPLVAALADRYRLERELGEGGMATVYLARDLKHERAVAIKVLKPELAAVLGLERFLAEIKVTAHLQHPNLLPLFDSGEAAGLLFYVMPFVEGETLRARLERERQLPIDEGVRIAVAIAQALEHAHRRGVIHRDLKPENVLLPDGQPVVADFGIALAVSNAGGQRITQTGLSLGTPQYMSPEQATGDRTVDARTDVYSLGAMTYEMLTGEPPHVGGSAQAIIAKLMTEEVRPLTVLRRSVPAHVDAAVRQALEKLPADRFASAHDFAQAMLGKGDGTTLRRYRAALAGGSDAPSATAWRERAAWGLSAVALLAAGWLALRPVSAPPTPVVRAKLDTPSGENVMVGGFPIAISAQGDRLAYVLQGPTGYRTVMRRVSELGREVTLSRESLRSLTFSPDGRWLAYATGFEIRRMPSDGGPSERLAESGGRTIAGLSYAPDGQLVVGTATALLLVPARGGVPRVISDSLARHPYIAPVVLPDGKTVIARTSDISDGGALAAVSLATGAVTPIGIGGARALGFIDGHLVYQTAVNTLGAVPFDLRTRKAVGDAMTLETGADGFGLSASGTLAFLPFARNARMVVAGDGTDAPVRDEIASYFNPRLSPDGDRIAVEVQTADGADIWVFHRTTKTFRRLTTKGVNTAPEWSPDGTRILYKSVPIQGFTEVERGTTIMAVPADGSGPSTLLYQADMIVNEAVLSPDATWLVLRTAPSVQYPRDIMAVPLAGDRRIVPLATGPSSEQMPRLSPDGRWLAYMSDVSGRMEIYVRPFPGEGARVQVSNDGGTEPMWDRAGRTLYYRSAEGLMATAVTTGASFAVGARRVALAGAMESDVVHQSYDVMPDGRRFLIVRRVEGEGMAIVVHNWGRELRERLANAKR